jgi:hypothetical protein
MSTFTVGCGAGFSGDRVDAPGPVVRTLIRRGGPSALMFETLAERTLATAQLARRADPNSGYEPLLELAVGPVLADCLAHGITIVGNFGAANPQGAAGALERMARQAGLPAPRIAVVSGDDLSDEHGQAIVRDCMGAELDRSRFVCATVYQGAFEIAQAIRAGAQIVVTGRVADPSLALGPALAHFDWDPEDWDALAGATMAGHLLECGAQVTGGYFCDPGMKDVPGLEDVGFPLAEISRDGSCVITKADHTGGLVSALTVKEQLLYEVHDPSAYLTPDVSVDLTQAEVTELGPDRVRLSGVKGHRRPATLKAMVFNEGGWLAEGEISYAGRNAEARARRAMEVMQKRCGGDMHLRFDLIGLSSIHGDDANAMLNATTPGQLRDVRLRVAGRHEEEAVVDRLLRELTALWTGGPAGGGGVRVAKRRRLSNVACYIPRELIPARFDFLQNGDAP